MKIREIPFHTSDWESMETTRHEGETGFALWKTIQVGDVRVRYVEYSANYTADHWCSKGHILLCLEGEMRTELKDGRQFILKKGTSYQVGDNMEPHRSSTNGGCKLFIVD
jgi:quercetin dioxygenase-like cupin family protein